MKNYDIDQALTRTSLSPLDASFLVRARLEGDGRCLFFLLGYACMGRGPLMSAANLLMRQTFVQSLVDRWSRFGRLSPEDSLALIH